MKKLILNVFAAATLLVAFTSCKNDKAKEAETKAAETAAAPVATATKYVANKETSTIEWKGFKPTESHNGTISIDSGVLAVKDGKVESGTFLIDMNSIVVLDIPADKEGNAKLVKHLKDKDFFEVAKYPTSAFEVTGFEAKDGKDMLSGNLTLNGVKNNISFPVKVVESGDELTLMSEPFTIDRTKWGVKFKSKSVVKDLGDNFIKDDIEFKITIKGKKS